MRMSHKLHLTNKERIHGKSSQKTALLKISTIIHFWGRYEFRKFFKNTFFTEQLWMTASILQ